MPGQIRSARAIREWARQTRARPQAVGKFSEGKTTDEEEDPAGGFRRFEDRETINVVLSLRATD
jgi:hypothetical protein